MFKLKSIGPFIVMPLLLLPMRAVFADEAIRPYPVPPYPSATIVDAASSSNGNPINKPVTGAAIVPGIVGGERPPSLEYLQATRPGAVNGYSGLDQGREEVLHQAGLMYGAQGGLAARAFALNEMLRRYEGALNAVFDFRPVVVRVGGGKTLLRPPIVSQAQMAFALGDGGQVARETACVYSITRQATLASAPPEWRAYLVRDWAWPRRPADAVLPRSEQEVAFWNKYVAEGWGQGEKQAVDIFLSDLGRLQRDLIGMARYKVLLRAGVVESPKVAFQDSVVNGGGVELRAGDRIVRITDQQGLKADRSAWPKATRDCPR
jgi:defect-in-organelle-trafficking protein DotC